MSNRPRKKLEKWFKSWKLTYLHDAPDRYNASWGIRRYVVCECECWVVKEYLIYYIMNKERKDCWCWFESRRHLNNKKHWHCWTRMHWIWSWMKSRCNNPKCNMYFQYWERGIWYDDRRNDFKSFNDDMWELYKEHVEVYWEKQTTLDRIDTNWDYCKENCKWSTYEEQNNNRRKRRRHKKPEWRKEWDPM